MVISKKISVSQGITNRDMANLWDLENGNFLAFLADAPSHSEQRTGLVINNFINQNIEDFKHGLNGMGSDEISLYMADLVTRINDELLKIGQGDAYATLSLVLAFNDYLYILSVGDSAAYIIGKTNIRLSEITRVNGHSILKQNIIGSPTRYRESTYIGHEKRMFTQQKDVCRLSIENVGLITLVSDGAEIHFGVNNLLNILSKENKIEEKEALLRNQLDSQLIKDDVTILLAEVKIHRLPSKYEILQDEVKCIKERLVELESKIEKSVAGLREREAQSPQTDRPDGVSYPLISRVDGLAGRLNELEKEIRFLKDVNSEILKWTFKKKSGSPLKKFKEFFKKKKVEKGKI